MEDGTSIPKNPVGSRLPKEIREEKKLIKKGGDCNRKGGLRNINKKPWRREKERVMLYFSFLAYSPHLWKVICI